MLKLPIAKLGHFAVLLELDVFSAVGVLFRQQAKDLVKRPYPQASYQAVQALRNRQNRNAVGEQ